jgi:hypothetical protein
MIAMKSQLTFTPEVLTCYTLYNHCDYYYLTLLVIYEHLNILAMYCYNLYPAQPEEHLLYQNKVLLIGTLKPFHQ